MTTPVWLGLASTYPHYLNWLNEEDTQPLNGFNQSYLGLIQGNTLDPETEVLPLPPYIGWRVAVDNSETVDVIDDAASNHQTWKKRHQADDDEILVLLSVALTLIH